MSGGRPAAECFVDVALHFLRRPFCAPRSLKDWQGWDAGARRLVAGAAAPAPGRAACLRVVVVEDRLVTFDGRTTAAPARPSAGSGSG